MRETIEVFVQRIPLLIALAALLCGSAFFSGAETALFSLTREDMRKIKLLPSRTGRCIVMLLENPGGLLTTLLFGNMVVNVMFYSLSFLLTLRLAEVSTLAAGVSAICSFAAVVLFGEVSPKGIAVRRPMRISHFVARPLCLFHRVARPARSLLGGISHASIGLLRNRFQQLPYVTSDELRMLVEIAQQKGVLDRSAGGMITQVVKLAEIRVKEVMTPRVDMVVFNLAGSRAAFCELVMRTREDLIPVYEGSEDNILGVIRARDVFAGPGGDLRAFLLPVLFAPETQPLERLLRQFRRSAEPAAIVVDEFGGTSGLVTLEHIMEEIVGDIRDEFEPRETPVRHLGQDVYLLAGDLSAREWRQLLGFSFDVPGVETVGGFVMTLLDHMPRQGDAVEWRGLRFVVEKMQGRRILEVRVQKIPLGTT